MPYIKQEKRAVLDPVVDELLDALRQLEADDPSNNTEGNLNYVISRILNRLYVSNYRELNNALGMLQAVASEYYRRVGSQLEEQRRFENGDVYDLYTVQDFVEDKVAEDRPAMLDDGSGVVLD